MRSQCCSQSSILLSGLNIIGGVGKGQTLLDPGSVPLLPLLAMQRVLATTEWWQVLAWEGRLRYSSLAGIPPQCQNWAQRRRVSSSGLRCHPPQPCAVWT